MPPRAGLREGAWGGRLAALLRRAPDSLLPHRLCCSPPFVLDTLVGSPAEVSFLSNHTTHYYPRASSASSSYSPEWWPCSLVDIYGMAMGCKTVRPGTSHQQNESPLSDLGLLRAEAVFPLPLILSRWVCGVIPTSLLCLRI